MPDGLSSAQRPLSDRVNVVEIRAIDVGDGRPQLTVPLKRRRMDDTTSYGRHGVAPERATTSAAPPFG